MVDGRFDAARHLRGQSRLERWPDVCYGISRYRWNSDLKLRPDRILICDRRRSRQRWSGFVRSEKTLGGNEFQDRRGGDIGSEEGFDDHLDRKIPERGTSFNCD